MNNADRTTPISKRQDTSTILGVLLVVAMQQSPAVAEVDLDAYTSFLAQNQSLTTAQFMQKYGGDTFRSTALVALDEVAYIDSIDHHYTLSHDEESLLKRHSFVVTERVRPRSFGSAYLDIYHQDLPLFISTDAILHAFHRSYDAILAEVESHFIWPQLELALTRMHRGMPALETRYGKNEAMQPMLRDIDLYLVVALRLLGEETAAFYPENEGPIAALLAHVDAEKPQDIILFGTERFIDFSQFTVRGHYNKIRQGTSLIPLEAWGLSLEELKEWINENDIDDIDYFGQYFQAMIWLGRTEFYLDLPRTLGPSLPIDLIQRQAVDAALLHELAVLKEAEAPLNEIERLLGTLIGQPDNLAPTQLQQGLEANQIASADHLLDLDVFTRFQEYIRNNATQHILSQILPVNPTNPDEPKSAPSFLLIGQRFVIDSYITGHVVYPSVDGRLMPSPLDVAFALGNDAAAQFLQPALEGYRYAPNLAALRFLADSQEATFWDGTLYHGWLNAIRSLSPPADRQHLPAFMQTASWWQQKLNTQLAAWAQLRHDNLLYAKQSYTGGILCSYPHTFIEPVPAFYKTIGATAQRAATAFASTEGLSTQATRIQGYFTEFASIADTLASIAVKELDGLPFSEAESIFLRTVLFEKARGSGCAGPWATYDGWYSRLFYTTEDDFIKEDLLVADVHTQPTDAAGTPVGYILHVGTGPLNTAVVISQRPECGNVAFVGPVFSFYEHITGGFDRLDDDRWKAMVRSGQLPARPDWVNSYLADSAGRIRGPGRQLASLDPPTLVAEEESGFANVPSQLYLAPNTPNPFNSTTVFRYTVPQTQEVQLAIFNTAGQQIVSLVNESHTAGTYSIPWDGIDDLGRPLASGVYLYRLQSGQQTQTRKLLMLR